MLLHRRETHWASTNHMSVTLVQGVEMYDPLPYFYLECSVVFSLITVKQLVATNQKKRNKLEPEQ